MTPWIGGFGDVFSVQGFPNESFFKVKDLEARKVIRNDDNKH